MSDIVLERAPSPTVIPPNITPSATTQRTLPFVFTGKGGEYFKIWIVNVLLTIVTLGIYSAWAKVRNQQYFYGNTRLDNSTFEYTAKPLQILKGRLIAAAFLLAYMSMSTFFPIVGALLLVVLFAFFPLILMLSMRFNARNTQYRNINLDFKGNAGGAYEAFLLYPIVGVISVGLLIPFAWKKQFEYIVDNHSVGQETFNFSVGVGKYYRIFFVLLGLALASILILSVLAGVFAAVGATMGLGVKSATLFMVPFMVGYLLMLVLFKSYFKTATTNLIYNNTQVASHRFSSDWAFGSYLTLMVSNTLLIIITLGLYIPFAKIKHAAYKAEHTQFIAMGDLNDLVNTEAKKSTALGEGISDVFSMDISI